MEMTREEFYEWAIGKQLLTASIPDSPLDDWRQKKVRSILKRDPFDSKEAETFINMLKYDFDCSLYFFVR